MAIAKSLGLGIGEVKLIIDLFESGEQTKRLTLYMKYMTNAHIGKV